MAIQPAAVKATPDLGKLAGMTNRVVQVSKYTSKNGAGQIVVPPQKGVSVDEIVGLIRTVGQVHGAGTYNFEVFDEGGTDKDTWTARLGTSMEEQQMGSTPMGMGAAPGYMMQPQPGTGVAPEGSIALGNGYFYNQELGLLSAPGRAPIPWRPGEPIPLQASAASPAASPAASSLPPWLSPPAALPWGSPPPWASPPWGTPTPEPRADQRYAELEARLADSENRRREETHRQEMTELRAQTQRMFDDVNRRFEQLFAKLGEKPAGPTPEFVALQSELASMKSTGEATAREDRLRAEFQAQQQRFEGLLREVTANKSDPMMSFLGQIMQSFQASQTSTVQAMQAATQSTTEKLSGSVMGPMQMMQMMQMLRDNPADKAQSELFSTIFGMMQNLLRTQAELNTDNTPPWVPLAQQGMESVGQIAQALMARQPQVPQQQQPQMLYAPPPQRQQAPQQPRVQTVRAQPVAGPVAAPAVVVTVDPRAGIAERVFHTGTTSGEAARAAAAASTGLYANGAVKPEAPPAAAAAASAEKAPPAAAAATPIQPDGVIQPRRRRRRGEAAAAAAAEAPAAPPAPAVTLVQVAAPTPVSVTPPANAVAPPQISHEAQAAAFGNATIDDVRQAVAEIADQDLFGPLSAQIVGLRSNVLSGALGPVEVASIIVQAPAVLQGYGAFPPILELYNAGHFEVLVERLLPQAPPPFRAAVVQNLIDRTSNGATGTDDDEDDDDEDDEGEEDAA